jgi:hypothetical protein
MTGYTVHTGATKKFVAGWDQIFGQEPAEAKKPSPRKKSAQANKTAKKKPAKRKSATAKKQAARRKKS